MVDLAPRNAGPSGDRCPHGDESCPCQDWHDPCHYEGPDRMECPTIDAATKPHCHLEGCGWVRPASPQRPHELPCGLIDKLGATPPDLDAGLDSLRGTPWWACGEARRAAATP